LRRASLTYKVPFGGMAIFYHKIYGGAIFTLTKINAAMLYFGQIG
jgi:hypothetical protein